jgi:ABC-type multidrug transport system fused ATPase/permease subunit
LWSYLKPYWKLELLMFGTMIGLTLVTIAMPLALKYLIDDLIPGLAKEVGSGGNPDVTPVFYYAAFLAGLYAANLVISLGRDYLAGRVGANIIADMRSQLFDHLAHVPLRFFQTNQVGQIMSRLLSDVQRVQSLLTSTFLVLIMNILLVIAVLTVLLVWNWKWALVALIPVPITIILSNRFGISLHRINRVLQETIARLSGRYQESFSAIRTVRAFAQEKREKETTDGILGKLTGLYIRNSVMNSAAVNLVHLTTMLAPIASLSWGAYVVAGGSVLLGTLLAFYILVGYLYSPVQELAQINVEIEASMASVYRIFEYLDIEPAVKEDENPVHLEQIRGHIVFDNVSFRYDQNGFRIEDLSLVIEPGEKVAIVGPSGAGKTTVINLILRFFDPDKGTISIDGVDLRRVGIKNLRTRIGLVDQEPLLFKASLFENIAYGDPDADLDRVIRAARIANIHDFITKLPAGYKNEVGERGVTLSGGERQRVCLARAILKDPPIMLLDEATSSLDTRSEELIQHALEKALEGKTSVIIAHRLATVRHADRIIVMDRGRIVDQGTHEQLLERSPLYSELARKQLKI